MDGWVDGANDGWMDGAKRNFLKAKLLLQDPLGLD
jgi:hypothetical protein